MLLKIPLETIEVDDTPTYVWTILSDHVPSGGTHRAQLQIEAAEQEGDDPEGAFILWQTMAFQIKAWHTIPVDV